MNAADPEPLSAFLMRDYELKVRFLTDHYARMWTRFNFFMVANTALVVGLFGALKDGKTLAQSMLIPVAGAILALCWYVFGAQDRHLVAAYRWDVERIGRIIAKQLDYAQRVKTEDAGPVGYIPVGVVSEAPVDNGLLQWRVEAISTTKLAAAFPLLVFVLWTIAVVIGLAQSAST